MRCIKIQFNGYKRLVGTSCDVTPRLVAFVGQNEAGKSSVLKALEWLSEEEETPIEPLDRSRANKNVEGWMVGAVFRLDAADVDAIRHLGLAQLPDRFGLWKQAKGNLHPAFYGIEPRRDPAPFQAAVKALTVARRRLRSQFETLTDEGKSPEEWATQVGDLLADPEAEWDAAAGVAATALIEWLRATVGEDAAKGRDAGTADLIAAARDIALAPHPGTLAKEILLERAPVFLQFSEEDRELPTLSPVDPRNPRQVPLVPAVENIFTIAALDPQALWAAHVDGNTGEVASLCEDAHERLDAFFGQAWNQERISVRISTHADGLMVHTYELESKRHTRMEERSDGLRAFIALAAFLEAQRLDVPPILLIDEAETHLHLNAQADLVGVLLKQIKVSQVLYTTHSPACLPSDLGTGIRLVERTDAQTSVVKNHFWTNEAPGYSPLLFAMGANAAAFSMCRAAVLAEGAGDMVLLPTLLRLANGINDLDYQIAPGLANARAHDMKVEEVAAKVMYLTDGDKQGKQYRKDLITLARVPEDRICSLPDGLASEDLLDPDFFLETIATLLPADAPKPTIKALSTTKTITAALQAWAARHTVNLPGKVAMAYAVIEQSDIRLTPDGRAALISLHRRFTEGFNAG